MATLEEQINELTRKVDTLGRGAANARVDIASTKALLLAFFDSAGFDVTLDPADPTKITITARKEQKATQATQTPPPAPATSAAEKCSCNQRNQNPPGAKFCGFCSKALA